MACKNGQNGPYCEAPQYIGQCANAGNLFAKVLKQFWNKNLPRVTAFDGTRVTIQGVREYGMTAKMLTRLVLPQLIVNRLSSITPPHSELLPALGTVTVNLNTAFPLVTQIGTMIRGSFANNVPDSSLNVTREIATIDTTAAVPKQDTIEFTLNPTGCNTSDRVQVYALVLDGVNKGGSGVVVPAAKTFGPSIQTGAGFAVNGQINLAQDTAVAAPGTLFEEDSLNETHNWICDILYGYDPIVQEDDGSGIPPETINQMADFKAQVDEAIDRRLADAGMPWGGQRNGNGFPEISLSGTPGQNGMKPNGNGYHNGNGNGTRNGNGNGVRVPRNGTYKNGKTYSNGYGNGNRLNGVAPGYQPPVMPPMLPQIPMVPMNPYGQYGVYNPYTGHPVPVSFPYPPVQSRQ